MTSVQTRLSWDWRRWSAVAAVVAIAAAVAAGLPSTPAANAQSASTPIVIGAYAPVGGTTLNTPEVLSSVRAAVDYINRDAKGINGRKLKLDECETQGTTESVTRCANELVQKKPLLVVGGPDIQASAGMPIYTAAGIPVIGGFAINPIELTQKIRTVFTGGSAAVLPGMATFAVARLHAKNVTLIATQSAANVPLKNFLLDPTLKGLGASEARLVEIPASSADYTPFLTTALGDSPDAILALGVRCVPFMQAYRSSGTKIPLILPGQCNDPSLLKDAGSAAEGVRFVVTTKSPALTPNDPQTKIYSKAIKKYADGNVAQTEFGLSAFASVMTIADGLRSMGEGQPTSAQVQTAFEAAVSKPNFLAAPYTCDPPASKFFFSVCNGSVLFAQVRNGKLTLADRRFVPVMNHLS